MEGSDINGLYIIGGMFALSLAFLTPTIKRDLKFSKLTRKISRDKLDGRVVEESPEEFCRNSGRSLDDYSQLHFLLRSDECFLLDTPGVMHEKYIDFPKNYEAITSFKYHKSKPYNPFLYTGSMIEGVALIPKHSS